GRDVPRRPRRRRRHPPPSGGAGMSDPRARTLRVISAIMTEPDKPSVPEQPQPNPYGQPPGGYPVPPPPPPYGGYPGHPAAPTAPQNGLGIAALVVAIVALLFFWSVLGGIVGGIVAVILGVLAPGRVKRGAATNGGVAL